MPRRAQENPDERATELLALGLSRYQAAAYASLAALGPAGPRQVAEAGGIPLARAYEALADLAAQGLAEEVPGPSKTFRPLPVEAALDRELARLRVVAASLASEEDALVREFAAPAAASEPPFLLHPGAARFGAAAVGLARSGRPLSAVLLWSTAVHVFGTPASVAAQRWETLVLAATPAETRQIQRLAWRAPGPRVLSPGAVRVERLLDGVRLAMRPAAGAGFAVALDTSDAAFVHDGLERVADAWTAATPLQTPGVGVRAVREALQGDGRA